jgi:methionine-rich copper-binding protein CopC
MRIPTWPGEALVACVLGAGLAFGHSGFQRSEPPVESKLKRSPSEVKLYFTERLEPAYSTVRVNDDHGAQVDRQDARVDPSNPLLLRVTVQPLEHGAYTVNWRVLSVDGHVTEGRFTFQVK